NTHELGLYIGAVPVLLCLWLLWNRNLWGNWKPLIIAATILAIAGIVLAAGEHGLVYRLQRWLPLVGSFRFPCRAIVLVHLAISVLTAIALIVLVTDDQTTGDKSTRPIWVVVWLSVVVTVIGPWLWGQFVASWQWIWLGPVLFLLAALFLAGA